MQDFQKYLQRGSSTVNNTQGKTSKNPIKRLYTWTVAWANHPSGPVALAIIAVVESSIFPIPPDVLLIPLACAAPKLALRFALICSAASVLGGMLGYLIGLAFNRTVVEAFINWGIFTQSAYDRVRAYYNENVFLAVLAAAFTPIPYKVFTIAAGVLRVDFAQFMLASVIGRSTRFFLEGGIVYLWGPKFKPLLEKYFDIFAIIIFVLIVVGFFLLSRIL